MDGAWIDRLARRLAGTETTTRRAAVRLGAVAALAGAAGLALAPEEAAACRAPKKPCSKGGQCCTGKCKKGKCASCRRTQVLVSGQGGGCWS